MNERKRLTEIKLQCAKMEIDANTIFSKKNKLEEEAEQLRLVIIKSEQLLGEAPWTLMISKEGHVSLVADAHLFPKLVKLCHSEWDHVRLDCDTKGVAFYEHDGDMAIDFSDKSKVKSFIQEHGITVDLSHASENIEELKKALKVYQEATKKFISAEGG